MRKLFKLLAIVFLVTTMFLYYLSHAILTPPNSDLSSVVLEAKSIYEGNIFLSGWVLSTVSYYTTDIPFYVLGVAIFGFTHRLLYIVPSLVYLMTAISTILVVYDGKRIRGSLVALCFISLPVGLFGGLALTGPIHIVAICFSLLCVKFLQIAERNKIFYLYFGLLFCWTLIGDTVTLWILGVPIILLGLYRIYVNLSNWKRDIIPPLIVIISVITSNITLKLITHFGGFKVQGTALPMFAELNVIGRNVYSTILGLLALFDANFFGKPIASMQTVILVFHFGIMIMIFCIIGHFLSQIIKRVETDYINQLMVASILVIVAAYLFSNMNVGTDSGRYLIPVVFFSVVLMGRWINSFDWNQKSKWFYITCIIFYIWSALSILPLNRNLWAIDNLQRYLQSQGLSNGYGSYWLSPSVTLHSDEKVKVRQVIANNLKIVPFDWLSERVWYNQPANFLIFESSDWGTINKTTAINTFGEPVKELHFEDVSILVWDKDISNYLSR